MMFNIGQSTKQSVLSATDIDHCFRIIRDSGAVHVDGEQAAQQLVSRAEQEQRSFLYVPAAALASEVPPEFPYPTQGSFLVWDASSTQVRNLSHPAWFRSWSDAKMTER